MDKLGLSHQCGAMAAESNPRVKYHLDEFLTIIGLELIDLPMFRNGYIQQCQENEIPFIEADFLKILVELRLMTQSIAIKYLKVTECINKKLLVEVYNFRIKETEITEGEILGVYIRQDGKEHVKFKNYTPTNLPLLPFNTDEWYPLNSFKILEVLGAPSVPENKPKPLGPKPKLRPKIQESTKPNGLKNP